MKGEDGAVLADKVIAITGASSGIGAEMARLFAERGYGPYDGAFGS